MNGCEKKACTECQVEWALLNKVIDLTNAACDMRPKLGNGEINLDYAHAHLNARNQWRKLMERTKQYYLKHNPRFKRSAKLYDSSDLDELEQLIQEEEQRQATCQS